MRLGMKGPRPKPPVLALAHHPLHILLRDLEIGQQHAFELVAPAGILGDVPDPLQGQPDMAVFDRLPKRLRPPEVSLRQLFNLPHTQLLAADGHHKSVDRLLFHPIHAHELPQCVHVAVNRKACAEDLLPHFFAHLADQSQPHAHPRFAPG